jgi:hypothetical protein
VLHTVPCILQDVYSMDCSNLRASGSWSMACCVAISEERCAMDSEMHSTKMFILWTALT